MNVSIVGRHLDLTEAMKSTISAVIVDIQKYNLDIIAVKVIIDQDKKGEFKVEFNVQVANRGAVVITQKDKDFYRACEFAKDRIEKVLRRYHDKLVSHRVKQDIPAIIVEDIADEDELVPVDLAYEKPMNVDEALAEFKQTNEMFFVFKDIENDTRILYRRKDGKFGLY